MLITLDGSNHVELRAAAETLWSATGRAQLETRVVDALASEVHLTATALPDRCVIIVVAVLLDLPSDSELVHRLIELAPVISRLAMSSQHATTALLRELNEVCELMQRHFEDVPLAPLALGGSQLETAKKVGVAVFIVSAAAETLRALVAMCILEAKMPLDERRTARQLLKEVSPVPYAFYSPPPLGLEVQGDLLEGDEFLALCLHQPDPKARDLVFGLGSHYCLGARLTLAIGDFLLSVLPPTPAYVSGLWDTNGITWRLVLETRSPSQE